MNPMSQLLQPLHHQHPHCIASNSNPHPLPRIMRMLSPCISEYLAGDCNSSNSGSSSSNNSTSAAYFLFARSSLSSISKEMHSTIQHEIIMYERKSKRRWKTAKEEIESQIRQLSAVRALLTAAEQTSLDQQLYRLFYDPVDVPPELQVPGPQPVDLAPLNYFTPFILSRMITLIHLGAQLHCHSSSYAQSSCCGDHLAMMLQQMTYSRENANVIMPRGRTDYDTQTKRDACELWKAGNEKVIHIPTCFLILQQCLLSNPSSLFTVLMPLSHVICQRGGTLMQLICVLGIRQRTHDGTTLIEYQTEFQQFADWCLTLLECIPPLSLPRLVGSGPLTTFLSSLDTIYSNQSLMERWCFHELLELVNRQRLDTNHFKSRVERNERFDEMQWSIVARLLAEPEKESTAASSPTISCLCTLCTIVTATNRILGASTSSSSSASSPTAKSEEMKHIKHLQDELKKSVGNLPVAHSSIPPSEMSEEEKGIAEAETQLRIEIRRRFLARCRAELTSLAFLPLRILTLLFPVLSSDAKLKTSTTGSDSLPVGVNRLLSICTSSVKSNSFSWYLDKSGFLSRTKKWTYSLPTLYDDYSSTPLSSVRELISHHVCCDKKKKRTFGRVLQSREFRELCQTLAQVEEIEQKMTDDPQTRFRVSSTTNSKLQTQCLFHDPYHQNVYYPTIHPLHPLTQCGTTNRRYGCTQCGRHNYNPYDLASLWVDEVFYSCHEQREDLEAADGSSIYVCRFRFMSSHATSANPNSFSLNTVSPRNWEVCSRCVEGHVRIQLQKQYQLAVKEQKVDWTLNSIHYRPELHHHPLQCCEVNVAVSCRHCHQMMEESQSILQYRCRFVSCAYSVCRCCIEDSYYSYSITSHQTNTAASTGSAVTSPVTHVSPTTKPYASSPSSLSLSVSSFSASLLSSSTSSSISLTGGGAGDASADLSSLIRDSFAVRTFISSIYFEFIRRKELRLVKIMHQLIQQHSHANQLKFTDTTNASSYHTNSCSVNNIGTINNDNHDSTGESPLMYLCSRVNGLRLRLFDFLLTDTLSMTNGDMNAILSEIDDNGVTLKTILQKPANRELLERLTHAYPSACAE